MRLALASTAPLGSSDAEWLFRKGISWLDQCELLTKAVRWGVPQWAWRQMAAHLIQERRRHAPRLALQALLPRGSGPRSEAFERIKAAIGSQLPLLALIRGSYDHYSVISSITAARLGLFDSVGYSWLTRDACTFSRDGTPRRHRLPPRALMVLRTHPLT